MKTVQGRESIDKQLGQMSQFNKMVLQIYDQLSNTFVYNVSSKKSFQEKVTSLKIQIYCPYN